jgi:hypothetical protein
MYKIKITGEGTIEQIIEALKALQISLIDVTNESKLTFEDETLFIEITEL